MPIFDPQQPYYLRYSDAVAAQRSDGSWLIANGALAQYRANSLVSWGIRSFTNGCHSHSAMVRRNKDDSLDVLELREFIGGRAVPLEGQVHRMPAQIDIFVSDFTRWPEANPDGAVAYMRELTNRDYGYSGVFRLALMRLPLLRWLWRYDQVDARDSNKPPFCSHAFSVAWAIGGNVPPVLRKSCDLITPAELTCSWLFSEYVGTLVPDDWLTSG